MLFLVETWQDSDSMCFRRLRADGHQVIDKPRPRVRDDALSQNHWRRCADIVYRCASPTSRPRCLTHNVPTAVRPRRVRHVVVFRRRHLQLPGSVAVSTAFYRELADVVDCLATYAEPVSVVGDLNVRLDRLDDSSSTYSLIVACLTASPHRHTTSVAN